MNWNFLAHIIRDVFGQPLWPLIYGGDPNCLEVFRGPEHGLNFWMIYGNNDKHDFDDSFLPIDIKICQLRGWTPDFFIALDEPLEHPLGLLGNQAFDLKLLMQPQGLVVLVNPGEWAEPMENLFIPRPDLIKQIKSYSMFAADEVYVYENI